MKKTLATLLALSIISLTSCSSAEKKQETLETKIQTENGTITIGAAEKKDMTLVKDLLEIEKLLGITNESYYTQKIDPNTLEIIIPREKMLDIYYILRINEKGDYIIHHAEVPIEEEGYGQIKI